MKKMMFFFIAIVFLQCKNEESNLITKNKVGEITKLTEEKDIDILFKNDSIVKQPKNEDFVYEYLIYSEGKHVLSIFPMMPKDTVKYIERIQIYSPKYQTEKGISTNSTYKDIASNYSINKIDPTIQSAIVYIDELNGTIALDKKDLGLDEFNLNRISKDQVPDMAKINYITIWFD